VADILADRAAGLSVLAPRGTLGLAVPVSAKTGTSTGWRDRWTVGFTGRVTVAVWVGNFDGGAVPGLAAAAGAAPLFARLMNVAARRYPDEAGPVRAAALETAPVCSLSGLRAGPTCPHPLVEKFLPGTAPAAHCTLHDRVAVDVRNGLRAGPGCPAAYVRDVVAATLPDAPYDAWLADPDAVDHAARFAPETYSPLCPAAGESGASARPSAGPVASDAGAPTIVSPRPGAHFVLDPARPAAVQAIPLRAEVPGAPASVVWRVDGRVLTESGWPYRARLPLTPGVHELVAVATGTGAASPPVLIEVR